VSKESYREHCREPGHRTAEQELRSTGAQLQMQCSSISQVVKRERKPRGTTQELRVNRPLALPVGNDSNIGKTHTLCKVAGVYDGQRAALEAVLPADGVAPLSGQCERWRSTTFQSKHDIGPSDGSSQITVHHGPLNFDPNKSS